MKVTLLGTGDTTGTPTPGCDCETCEQARERGVERTRFSVYVYNERIDSALLIDASPDFRYQFLREDVPLPDAAIITHVHFDHLDGLGNAFRLFRDLPVHATDEVDPEMNESIAQTVRRRFDYLEAIHVEPETPYEPFRTAGFDVTLVPVDHPPLLCYGVVIEDNTTGAKLSISGDTSYAIPEQSKSHLADPDLLLADGIVLSEQCEYHPKGGAHHDENGVARTYGTKHMTVEGALSLGDELNADETRVVHVSHYIPAERAFENALAVDGEQFEL